MNTSELYDDYVELLKLSLLDLLGPTTTRVAKVLVQRKWNTRRLERIPGTMTLLRAAHTGLRRALPTSVAMRSGPRRVETVPEQQRAIRLAGDDYPANAMTMMGYERLTNVQRCIEDVIARNVHSCSSWESRLPPGSSCGALEECSYHGNTSRGRRDLTRNRFRECHDPKVNYRSANDPHQSSDGN